MMNKMLKLIVCSQLQIPDFQPTQPNPTHNTEKDYATGNATNLSWEGPVTVEMHKIRRKCPIKKHA